jgi:hypothetical protein
VKTFNVKLACVAALVAVGLTFWATSGCAANTAPRPPAGPPVDLSHGGRVYDTGSYIVIDASALRDGVAVVGGLHVSKLAGSTARQLCVSPAGDVYAGSAKGC